MPTTALPRRAAALAAGVALALALTPAPGRARPVPDPTDQRLAAQAEQLEIVIEKFNELREDLRETQARAAALRAELATLEREIETHRAEVAGLAARVYRAGDTRSLGMLGALIAVDTRENLVDPLLLLDRLTRQERRTITRLTEARTRLTEARGAAETLLARQRAQQRQLAERRKRIEREIERLAGLPIPPDTLGDTPAEPPSGVAGPAGTAVRFAYAQLGKPYRWGAAGPDGYDCSGLTAAAWAAAGVRLPHNAARQWRAVTPVSRAARRPGDLVFYYRDLHHVGMYVGGGKIIHAPRTGQRIRVDRVDYQPVYGYGRPG